MNTEFTAVKVFSATKAKDRDALGERVTDWLRRRKPTVVAREVLQSSDNEFHCLSLVFFYREARRGLAGDGSG